MAKAIMVQGTMSNAGKSLMVAGLCRIFMQDGYRVAPFKSQNMALNSFITREGLEMGRAQVLQAKAAGIEPSCAMNPILLKPSSDTGSQVIVNGKPLAFMGARDYFAFKKSLLPVIKEAYQSLDQAYDIIVLEGAGSPAEINLNQEDIVNMGMARLAGAPVLLVGDIDRGGVFAQLYGTVMLLQNEERLMVKGLIVNKFRGDKTLLEPGLSMIEELCQIPVVGVAPYLMVDLEDEDSLSDRLSGTAGEGLIEIGIIRLPRMSNFTDFQVFTCFPAVKLSYVSSPGELLNPDMVILPGTKNTMDDLLWLRQSGLETKIQKLAKRGVPVIGICGGYQMMGNLLKDEAGIESGRPLTLPGLGLLPFETEFEEEKVQTRVKGRISALTGFFAPLSGLTFEGYEIHMGRTYLGGGCENLAVLSEYQEGAAESKLDGGCLYNCLGTYVHGIFDQSGVAKTLLELLAERKGLENLSLEEPDYESYREQQLDRLADGLRENLDMEAIYRILEDGI